MLTQILKKLRTKSPLGISLRRRTLGFSHIEGGLFALMVGCSETFVLYYAVKRGVSPSEFALISSVPLLLGALANWLIPLFVSSRFLKPSLLCVVFAQILGLLGLFTSIYIQNHFLWILLSLSLYWIGGMASSPLWIDWMSGWLPTERMGRYLSRRNGFTALMTVIAYLLAALWIHKNETLMAYQIIFGIAFIFRSISFVFLTAQPHPTGSDFIQPGGGEVLKVLKSKPILVMMVFTVLFRFVANTSSPFFLPYMVNELHFSLMDYAWIAAVPFLARAVFLAQWGEAIRSYRPFVGLQIAMLISTVICILWTFTSSIPYLTIIEAFSGIAWGGFELSCIVVMYGFLPRNARGIIGLHMALQHLAGLLGALVGSHFLNSGMTSLELIRLSAGLRFAVAAGFILIGLRLDEIRVNLKVYGEFFMTAMTVKLNLRRRQRH